MERWPLFSSCAQRALLFALRPATPCTLRHAPAPSPPFTLGSAPWLQNRTPKKKGTKVLEGKTRSSEVRFALPAPPLHLAPRPLSNCPQANHQRRSPPPILLQVPLQLQVTGTGRTTMVDASPTMTAARLSRVIEKQTGVPRGSFALYHGSKPMRGTLEESGVAFGSTVELKFRGRGGGPEPQAANSLEVEIAARPAQVNRGPTAMMRGCN